MKSINRYFLKSKELPIDKFIDNVMFHKNHGYYSKKIAFGSKGDFVTSPEISFLFSEMIAIWIISFWMHLKKPKKFNIVELGPGTGSLSKILIKTFSKFPEFFSNSNIFLYEKSKKLQLIQKNNLKDQKVKWIKNFNKLKSGPTFFFGNEFFDAIPIKQYKKVKGEFFEVFVKLDDNLKIKYKLKKIDEKIINQLKQFNLIKNRSFIEFPKMGLEELALVSKIIKKNKGGIMLVDYGFLKQKNVNTLQSVRNNRKNNLFEHVGNADMTSLVDFNILKKYFKKKKLFVNSIVTQSFFLKRMGIVERSNILSQNMSFKEKSDLYLRLKRLLGQNYMGKLFKVIFAMNYKKKFTLGFN